MSSDPGRLPDPETQVFEAFFRVRFHEVDALGHVNNAAYLNYLEQAAIDHATCLELDLERLRELGGVFVARRHEIVFLRPTFAGDVLRVVTWLEAPRGASVDRNYLVFRESDPGSQGLHIGRLAASGHVAIAGDLVTKATTEWVFANDRGKPVRIPGDLIEVFRSVATRSRTEASEG